MWVMCGAFYVSRSLLRGRVRTDELGEPQHADHEPFIDTELKKHQHGMSFLDESVSIATSKGRVTRIYAKPQLVLPTSRTCNVKADLVVTDPWRLIM